MTTTSTDTARMRRRVAVASLAGTTIEWYDFFIYGTAAALVFAPQFFPDVSPEIGTLAAFATFSVGFIARPLGGLVMGHLGDRVGRKSTMIACLLIMGVATVLIGLLPNFATIGIWAPVLLVALRFAQGFGVGGEWGGAVLMSVEHAPVNRRAVFGSFPQMGIPLGIILSTGAFIALGAVLSDEAFAAWGWRIPFLASAILIVVGLLIRLRVDESPEFAVLKTESRVARLPLLDVLRDNPRNIVATSLASIAASAVGQIVLVYTISYATAALGLPQQMLLWMLIGVSALWAAVILASAALSERVGRKAVYIAGSIMVAVWAFPLFALINTTEPALVFVGMAGGAIACATMAGAQAALIAEAFRTDQRYSGASISYSIGGVFGGGLAPLIAAALFVASASTVPTSWYLVVVSILSIGGVLLITAPRVRAAKSARGSVGTPESTATAADV